MRPEIPDEMAERIDALDDHHGYASAAEFIRESARRRLEKLEAKASVVESAADHGLSIEVNDLDVAHNEDDDES